MNEKEEKENLIRVLEEATSGFKTNNVLQLKSLSDQTIHSASVLQHTDYIVTAVMIYTLSKIIERRENLKIKDWDNFSRKVISNLSLSIDAIKRNNHKAFLNSLEKLRKFLTSSVNLKPYIQDVLNKASINKASKIYEHGISMGQTANLLGLTEWELADYVGSKNVDAKYNVTLNIKSRAKMAMDFFR